MDGFTFVEINGMKISEPMAAFSHLWQALAPADSVSVKISD
jgi:origin recognition complex subunit 1